MRVFCTYFDHHYLPRGLALHQSLQAHCPAFELWVLCLSDQCHETLVRLALPGIKLLTLAELEAFEPRLRAAKLNRSTIEYYFTCSPVLPLCVLERAPAAPEVTYVDGDLLLFHPLDELWEEIGDSSIAITPHRFPPALRESERYGVFNVGWLTFRRDANARACLEWWRDRCLEWCYDRLEEGRFADQKYLDVWPEKFEGVKVIQHPGVNLAPWNLAGHRLEWRDGRVLVDGRPLLVFHFHGLKQITATYFDPQWQRYGVPPDPVLTERIYQPYLKLLTALAGGAGLQAGQVGGNPRVDAKAGPAQQLSPWQRWRARRKIERRARRGEFLRC
ncbi:hypothetical protein LBMAG56_46630 [Verrucomicrobiota bacterium]|nr:hypothetical protein LBMAG56_46630 [Verrucomicrobiota bacterium]